MILTENQQNNIDYYLQQNQRFALWRIPGEQYHFIRQTSGPTHILQDIEEIEGLQGFIIAPFVLSSKHPIVIIKKDTDNIVPLHSDKTGRMEKITADDSVISDNGNIKENYMRIFDQFIAPLRNNEYDKLVLSRQETIKRPRDFSPARIFCEACERYPFSYIYLCHTPETGTWLGCTPEILIAGDKGYWHTMALAGTQPLVNGKVPQIWSDKNRREQGYVSKYIRSRLASFGIQPEETPAHPVQAAALSHLRTDFRFTLPSTVHLGALLKSLHPTPAVCGLPKEESFKFVLNHEAYDRSYYSGFIGWFEPEGKSDLYVNLRCMNIHQQQLTLYAGGGILASSEKESEWAETKAKMETLRRLISLSDSERIKKEHF